MILQTESIPSTVGDVTIVGHIVKPTDGPPLKPGVLVLPEWWGLNDYIRQRTADVAALGCVALGVDLYGDGKTAEHPDQAATLMNGILEDMETGTNRLQGALQTLSAQPGVDPSRLAAIGFCFGGAMALHMARIGSPIKAAVSFHGALDSFHAPKPGAITAKILVCHGDADEFISKESIDAFHDEMKAAQANYKFISYPGALHGFTSVEANENGRKYGLPLAYDESADRESWQAMIRLFKELF